jgi:hypothetical protein
MAKLFVQTTGMFFLVDPNNRIEIQHSRPTVVEATDFVNARAAVGQIRVIGDAPDDANDVDFLKFFKDSDGDAELAMESYKSTFTTGGEVEEEKPKRRGRPPKTLED